ncbi:guanylate kinase [Bacteroidia bacterium]|nr:guanylate kinase [Bacteroidia bacterium]
MSGKLVIFSAPSGAGKTTIVHEILRCKQSVFSFSVSATTRAKRPNEQHGQDYYFLSIEEFEQRISDNAFLEWEMVYEGCYYGTLRSEVELLLAEGKNVLLDVDVKGGINVKRQFNDQALAIFIKPPGIEALRQRLLLRNTETEETLNVRISKAEEEMKYAPQFDKIIVNDDLQTAIMEAEHTINTFLGLDA